MPRHRQGGHDAGVHAREPSEARDGPVYDLRAFARHFILIGVAGARVRVRRKADAAEGTLAFTAPPLRFSNFLPEPGRKPSPTRRGPRP
jgi:hypothetical protein